MEPCTGDSTGFTLLGSHQADFVFAYCRLGKPEDPSELVIQCSSKPPAPRTSFGPLGYHSDRTNKLTGRDEIIRGRGHMHTLAAAAAAGFVVVENGCCGSRRTDRSLSMLSSCHCRAHVLCFGADRRRPPSKTSGEHKSCVSVRGCSSYVVVRPTNIDSLEPTNEISRLRREAEKDTKSSWHRIHSTLLSLLS